MAKDDKSLKGRKVKTESGKEQTLSESIRVEVNGSAPLSGPNQSTIAFRAWQIWQHEGCPSGREIQNWLQAEKELTLRSK